MKVVNSHEMNLIDKKNITEIGIPGILLMENAARSVLEVINSLNFKNPNIAIICGTGNNGGDGFALARLCNDKNFSVKVFIVGDVKKICGDALINYTIINKIGIDIMEELSDLSHFDIIVDAIFGTGFNGEINGKPLDAINLINKSKAYTISIDIPSGIFSDTGLISNVCVNADETVTFGYPKIGNLIYPATEYNGKLTIKDISLQKPITDELNIKANFLTENEAKNLIPDRKKRTNKWAYGNVFVVAGSKNITGACHFASKAAYMSGAGLVYSCVVESIVPVIQTLLPEALVMPISENDGFISAKNYYDIYNITNRANVIVIGPGLGNNTQVFEFTKKIIENARCQLIIDADALNVISTCPNILKKCFVPPIITPHFVEMTRLSNKTYSEIENNTITTAIEFSKNYNCITVLKDARTIISMPDGNYYINTTGNASMAKGGSGDVLAGIIGGLYAQTKDAFLSSYLGVYIHGLSGDLAKKSCGEHSVLASDIIDNIKNAFILLEKI